MTISWKRFALVAALVAPLMAGTSAQAAITVYTDQATFLAALNAPYQLETFGTLPFGSIPAQTFSGNGHSFDASSPGGGLYGLNGALSVVNGTQSMLLNGFSGPGAVTAVGGYFFMDNNGAGISGSGVMNVTALTGDDTEVFAVGPTSVRTFVGFISNTTAFTSLSLNRTSGVGSGFVSVDDVTVGSVAGVPEPATWAMMIGGFALVGGAMRRRVTKAVFA